MTDSPSAAIDSRTIRTIILAIIGYTGVRFAIPESFMSQELHGALADVIVYAGFAIAAWFRKNARVRVATWWKS